MLKAVLSLVLPIIAFAAYFGGNAATVSSRVAPQQPVRTQASAPAGARQPSAFDLHGCRRGEEIVIAADAQGHFQISADIAGRTVPMMIDTGATRVILPHQDAVRVGLPLDKGRSVQVSTANGVVSATLARAELLRFGPICLRNVDVLVMPPGRLAIGLLGMSAIGELARFEMSRSRLVLAH